MEEFPLTKKLGLKIYQELGGINTQHVYHRFLVNAQDLEAALEKASIVYTDEFNEDLKGAYTWYQYQQCMRPLTHKALLINVEEIPREPLKMKTEHFYNDESVSCHVVVPKIFEGKKFRTIFEEIKE